MFHQLNLSGLYVEDAVVTPIDKVAAQLQASHPYRTVFKDRKAGLVGWVFTYRVAFFYLRGKYLLETPTKSS